MLCTIYLNRKYLKKDSKPPLNYNDNFNSIELIILYLTNNKLEINNKCYSFILN